MEVALRNSGGGGTAKEEKKVESSGDHEENCSSEIVLKVGNGIRKHEDDKLKQFSPNQDGKQVLVMTSILETSSAEPNSTASSSVQKDQDMLLESAKAEMGEVREENQRLRMHLNKIMKDYQTLQTHFYDIARQEAAQYKNLAGTDLQKETEEPELVSLRLGRTSSTGDPRKDDQKPKKSKEDPDQDIEGLALGLQFKYEMSKTGPTETSLKPSPENSLEVKEEAGESWPPHKAPKTMRSEDDEVSQQNPAKKARVSVRVRCDTPTMNDGCQWRKYGQKIAKGNPCPRAYYRCTIAPSCPVRKQVQRCAEDMSILITTYEGTHNHPLPVSATAMASTTSAAASMLLSGSSSSEAGTSSSTGTTISSSHFHGLNFYLPNNSRPKPFYLPNSSISPSPSYPTITLDLTSKSSSSFFNKISPNNFLSGPRYSSTNLNFSSLESNAQPISWTNGVLNYGTKQPHNKIQVGSLNFGRQPQENFHQSLMTSSNNLPPKQALHSDTIAAATKAITTDPTFQSALAAALTSIIGTNGGPGGNPNSYQIESDQLGHNLNLGEPFPVVTNLLPATSNGNNKCSSSYLNRSSSVTNSHHQQGSSSILFQQPPLPFSTSKSKSTSPGDKDRVL